MSAVRPFTDADVRRYAQHIAGHPDAEVTTQHLQAVRAVLDALASDSQLRAPVCGCGVAPDGAPGADGCSPSRMTPEPHHPQRVVDALTAAGFVHRGGRAGVYARMGWPEYLTGGTELVSLDDGAPEHDELMSGLLRKLENAAERGRVAVRVLAALRWGPR